MIYIGEKRKRMEEVKDALEGSERKRERRREQAKKDFKGFLRRKHRGSGNKAIAIRTIQSERTRAKDAFPVGWPRPGENATNRMRGGLLPSF